MDAPAVAVSADGKKMAVAWMDQRRGRGERDAFWRTIAGGKPGPEQPLGEAAGEQGHAALAIDKDGTVYAAWSSNGKILLATSKDPKPRQISDASESEATQPALATNGDLVVASYEARKGGNRISVCKPLP